MAALIITHTDFDGWLAGAIAYRWLREHEQEEPEIRHAHYGDACPISEASGRDVYLLDFSWPAEQLLDLQASARSLVWIDHHPGSVQSGLQIYGLRSTARCAAWLTWRALYPWQAHPQIVLLADDHDRWVHALPGTREVAAVVDVLAPAHGARWSRWEDLLDGDLETIVETLEQGRLLLRAQAQRVASLERRAVPMELEGHHALAVNATSDLNELADALDAEVVWIWSITTRDGRTCVTNSLRSRKGGIDVGAIAKGHGGGGHRSAAGWTDLDLAAAPIMLALGGAR